MVSAMTLPRRAWLEMTTEEISRADTSAWIAVLPIAAVEQHGPHLPLGTDTLIMQGCLERALALMPDSLPVTVLPVQAVGKSNEHLAFPGTLTLSAETAMRLWLDICESVIRAGVRKIVIVTSHGGNAALMDVVARELRVRHGVLACFTAWSNFGQPDGVFAADEVRLGIHGGAIETALMLALRPDLVRLEHSAEFRPATHEMEATFRHLRTGRPGGFGWMAQDLHPAGVAGDAARATAEQGRASAEFAARAFVELLEDVHRFDLSRLRHGPLGESAG
jgi:creatinine amidohydrolase